MSDVTIAPAPPAPSASTLASLRMMWHRFAIPLLVLLLAAAIVLALTRNWSTWEGARIEQSTNDAYVRGDLTPLSTKVAGLVRDVKVSDYQRVRKGDTLVLLEDDDFGAQVAQATAAVQAARAALENNRRQRALQDARIDRALAGIDQARAQIVAAAAGRDAVQADLMRTQAERTRQEALFAARSATAQKLEVAVADEQRFTAQATSRDADLSQAKTMLRSNELAAVAERRSKAVLESQDLQLAADLQAKEAALAAANVNLRHTRIVAPDDGTVGERQVRPGQLVSPGTQVISFIGVPRWVQANFRETQLTNVRAGDPAEVRVDVYPGEVLRGKVIEIAPASGSQFALLPPDNATGNFTKVVQRVPVKIALDDSTGIERLRPGLSVVVTLRTSRGASTR
jgi:membrane fusion protein, multidrug efflux system